MPHPEELTLEEYAELFRDLKNAGCLKIHFSGGEIFLRKDIMEILQTAKTFGFKLCMTTNGTLINKFIAKQLVKLKISTVAFSLDSSEPKIHDRQRGVKGSFKKTMNAIKLLRAANMKYNGRTRIRINTVITRRNYMMLPELTQLAADTGACELLPMPVDEKGIKKVRHRLSKSQIKDYNKAIAPLVYDIRKAAGFSTHPSYVYPFGVTKEEMEYSKHGQYAMGYFKNNVCHAPFTHTFIGWNGDVSVCCMLQNKMKPLGNVREKSIYEIFTGKTYTEFRKDFMKERLSACHRCDNFSRENGFLQNHLEQEGARQFSAWL